MAIRDIKSMLGELETLLKSQKGLNHAGKIAIEQLLYTLESQVRASLISDIIHNNEPDMQKVKEWITAEAGKLELEKQSMETNDSNNPEDPRLSSIDVRLRELREIKAGIENPEIIARRMTCQFINPDRRRDLINTMGEYLCSDYDKQRTFRGKTLAPRDENVYSLFKGFSINVDAMNELIEVVRDEKLVDKAAEIREKEELVEGDKTALLNFDSIMKKLPNETKIMDYASVQHDIDAENTTYEAARQSLTNYNGNAIFRFFSSRFGKLAQAKRDTELHQKTLEGLTPKADKLKEELESLGINANSENIVAMSNDLPMLKKEASIIVGINLFNKNQEDMKTTLEKYQTDKKSEFETHVNELNEAREKADKKISDLSYDDLCLVTECAGRDKSILVQQLGIGARRDPQFALLMFEVLIREKEFTPEMILELGDNKEKTQEGRNMVANTVEGVMRQRLDDIKGKLKSREEKKSDKDDR